MPTIRLFHKNSKPLWKIQFTCVALHFSEIYSSAQVLSPPHCPHPLNSVSDGRSRYFLPARPTPVSPRPALRLNLDAIAMSTFFTKYFLNSTMVGSFPDYQNVKRKVIYIIELTILKYTVQWSLVYS